MWQESGQLVAHDLDWNSTMTCNRLVRMLNGDILPGNFWAGRRTDDFGFAAQLWLWIISSCKLHYDGPMSCRNTLCDDSWQNRGRLSTYGVQDIWPPRFTSFHIRTPWQWSFDRVWLSESRIGVHDINWKPGAFDLSKVGRWHSGKRSAT